MRTGKSKKNIAIRSSTTNWNTQVGAISNNPPRQQPVRQQQPVQQTNTNKELCWSCGGIFTPNASHSAQLNKHNAASAKRQVILLRCAVATCTV